MDLVAILEAISKMSGPELERIREAVERRRERLGDAEGPRPPLLLR
jgi:hypothetical protein